MNVSVAALADAPEVVSGEVAVLKVQIIKRWDSFQANQRRDMYDDSAEDCSFLTQWIEDDVNHHQCVGLLSNATGQLRIWDFGKWLLPSQDCAHDRSTLAIRLSEGCAATGAAMPPTVNWLGLEVPTAGWAAMLPDAIPGSGILNIGLCEPQLSERRQLELLEQVFESSRAGLSALRTPAPYGATADIDQLAPTIIISGNHMSPNPCPGVGCSRGIRSRFPRATTVAIDSNMDVLSGMMDVTFDRAIALDTVCLRHLKSKAKKEAWQLVVGQLADHPDAFYLPCTDYEIDRCSEALETATDAELAVVASRLLCPPRAAVAATEKPQIAGAKAMGIFEVPNYMTLDASTTCQTDVETYCKRQGYPVMVKGAAQGANVCHTWGQVLGAISSKWGSGGFVQKIVPGFQLGVAFAAFDGELTGAVLMEKTAFNAAAKAWAGQFRACPARLTDGIRKFCAEYNWTGGAELEFIEDMAGNWHAIDWNPRFPAWIFAGTYAGVNLPAALVQHALHQRTGGLVPFPTADLELGATASGGFTRTVVEVPTLNCQQFAHSGIAGFATTNYTKAGISPHGSAPLDILPPGVVVSGKPKDAVAGSATDTEASVIERGEDEVLPDMEDRSMLATEINRLIPAKPTSQLQTPCFVLSRKTVKEQLASHRDAVQTAIDQLDAPLKLQMCLSVKTQPHPVVLAEAKAAGYCGEVITTAEMRACLDAGWRSNEVVMNGPGKWYDTPARRSEPMPDAGLRCLFADSIADLTTIVDRVLDSDDWLAADFIGVRFAPVWVATSRFGLDSKDPRVLRAAAEQIKRLPEDQQFGLHMHFASSKVGPVQWFGLAKGYLEIARGFADLCDREPTLLDFGGGWPAHLLDCPEITPAMIELLGTAQSKFPLLETVQFEPGKSITERAGAVLTKVLEIRETDHKIPRTATKKGASVDGSDTETETDDDDDPQDDDDEVRQAAVVDACISDMGSIPTHAHPLLWQKSSAGDAEWNAATAGKDEVWGSICMEFDRLGANVALPEGAAVGDHVLIAFCGAYDMTMSYEFADGKARDIAIV